MAGLNGEPLSYAVNVEAIDEMRILDPSMSPDAAVEKLLEKTFGSVYGNLPIETESGDSLLTEGGDEILLDTGDEERNAALTESGEQMLTESNEVITIN